MKKNLIFLPLILSAHISFAQCDGYPCDTLWYDELGNLKNEFVFNEVWFELGKAELMTLSSAYHPDSVVIINMHQRLDSLAKVLILDGGVFEIQYHSSEAQDPNRSINLTQARAKNICNKLNELGVGIDRLIPKGFSNTKPRILHTSESAIALTDDLINSFYQTDKSTYHFYKNLNRRVVIKRLD